MEIKEVFTASTIEEAKQKAVASFGLSEDQIVFKIIQEPKKSIFGKVKQEAEVEAICEKEDATPEEIKATASFEEKKEEKPTKAVNFAAYEEQHATEKDEDREAEEVVETPKAEEKAVSPKTETKTADNAEAETPEVSNAPGIESEPILETYTDETLPDNLRVAEDYISAIYDNLGVHVTITAHRTESGVKMDLSSDAKSGTIIGRRGETLDSVQYLASIVMNRHGESYTRLMLDSNGYRQKRRQTLENLAEKIANNVKRTGRSTALEPMNPYERRIIHSKISQIDGVTSKSVGEDPRRKVIISSTNPRKSYNNKNNYRGGRKNNNYRGGNKKQYREKRPEEYHRQDMDSMKTSFERDYKRPLPEDEIDKDTDLYGKIEL